MRSTERRWHIRLWLLIGPASIAVVVLAVLSRPRDALPAVEHDEPARTQAAPADGSPPP